jgi:hypothetical protein
VRRCFAPQNAPRLEGSGAVAPLATLVRLGNDPVKFAAAGCLVALARSEPCARQVGSHGAVPTLIRMCTFEHALCRYMAARVLAEMSRWASCRPLLLARGAIVALVDAQKGKIAGRLDCDDTNASVASSSRASRDARHGAVSEAAATRGGGGSQVDVDTTAGLREAVAVALERLSELTDRGNGALGEDGALMLGVPAVTRAIAAAGAVTPMLRELASGTPCARVAAAGAFARRATDGGYSEGWFGGGHGL